MPTGSFENDIMPSIELLNLTGVISIKFLVTMLIQNERSSYQMYVRDMCETSVNDLHDDCKAYRVMHNYYVLKNLQEILNSGENF